MKTERRIQVFEVRTARHCVPLYELRKICMHNILTRFVCPCKFIGVIAPWVPSALIRTFNSQFTSSAFASLASARCLLIRGHCIFSGFPRPYFCREELTGDGEGELYSEDLSDLVLVIQRPYRNQMKAFERGGSCDRYGAEEKGVQDFGG
jgi:hypothetical protein